MNPKLKKILRQQDEKKKEVQLKSTNKGQVSRINFKILKNSERR